MSPETVLMRGEVFSPPLLDLHLSFFLCLPDMNRCNLGISQQEIPKEIPTAWRGLNSPLAAERPCPGRAPGSAAGMLRPTRSSPGGRDGRVPRHFSCLHRSSEPRCLSRDQGDTDVRRAEDRPSLENPLASLCIANPYHASRRYWD